MIRIGTLGWELSHQPEIKEVSESSYPSEDNGIYSVSPGIYPDIPAYHFTLYENDLGETLLPFVVYRYQVPNALFPEVSNQVVQVTPMIERIRRDSSFGNVNVKDPFVGIRNDPSLPTIPVLEVTNPLGIYVRDTQGVVRGARYVYLLARFKENRELDRVYRLNPITIPD